LRYRQWNPSPALADYVECWWSLEGAASDAPQLIFPDGRLEVIFHLHDRFERVHGDGRRERQERVLIAGQLSRAVTLHAAGTICTVGVRLKPAAARLVTGGATRAVTDAIEPLALVNARLARRLSPPGGYASAGDCVAGVERILIQETERVHPERRVAEAVRVIEIDGGGLPIEHVAARAGTTVRTLQRRFLEEVGLTIKAYSRIVRFQRALSALQGADRRLIEAALAAGYSDQAHFTREFHDIAGMSPSRWLTADQPLSWYFTRIHQDRERRSRG
jgi:AraC-like DNA-binding protein